MARATRSWCCLLPFAFAALGASPSPMERADLTINNCEGYAIKFPHAARISVDKYCNDAASAYFVSGAGDRSVDGVYEKYGRLLGANKFERVLDDGTVYTLRRLPVGSPGSNAATWGLYRRGAVLYTSSGRSDRADPPPDGWRPAAGGVSPAPGLQAVTFPKRKLRIRRSSLGLRTKSPRQCDASARRSMLTQSCPEGADEELLDILHPAVGPQLGSFLRDRYKAAYPVESITLDGLIDADALSRALTFLDVPLSSWIGPEEAFYCCEKKFRLNFTEWPKTNVEVIGVQRLLSSSVFIRFLEELTGIRGLEPMTADDDRMLWAGSSLIAIAPGGYLHVHNDFNYQNDLYRRINVLLYLNEEWRDEWQGHLELWDPNAKRCVQRILPVFNRMSIFTVLDDAFHGHPEPSAAPPGRNRYALQLVYYTRSPPPERVTKFSLKRPTLRSYPLVHGAIFQTPCHDTAGLNMSYICSSDYAKQSHGGQPICECNFRSAT